MSVSVSYTTITIAMLLQFFSHGMAYYRSERTKGVLIKHVCVLGSKSLLASELLSLLLLAYAYSHTARMHVTICPTIRCV